MGKRISTYGRKRILWLQNVIGCPSIVRCDHGTENTVIASTHMALRHYHNDEFSGERSFQYGASTTNTVSREYF